MTFVRRAPGTAVYLVLLLTVNVVVVAVLPDGGRLIVERAVSTSLADVDWSFPLRLIGSAFVVDLTGGVLGALSIVLAGIAFSMGWLERRFGTFRALGTFAAVHVLATLVTLLVVAVALKTGSYPSEVRAAPDYGVSYGALGCMGAVTFLVPRRIRPLWVVVLILPLLFVEWFGWLPDFTTIGHGVSAVLGVAISRHLVGGREVTGTPRIL
ncbi:rhomboid family intramembrane serine protease [Actinocrispum sp. NPDC049592]|uniref:rhomboid family intramembrane serine protease n=1 Tax=Actinocrispum sp. NPDC049592 TaxID=3154835 RepID=UPI00342B3290